jgi:hypothetical protein
MTFATDSFDGQLPQTGATAATPSCVHCDDGIVVVVVVDGGVVVVGDGGGVIWNVRTGRIARAAVDESTNSSPVSNDRAIPSPAANESTPTDDPQ